VAEGAQPRRSSALQSPALAPPEPGTVERTGDQPAFPESRAPVANAAAPARPAAEQSRVAALPPNAEPRPEQAAPDPAAAARPRPGSPALTLSSEEIATHLARGEERLKAGELAAARLYFERVALAGDARGALGMARTYDPAVLARLPVLGPRADPAAAKAWYERAASQRAGG
jgi:TPR repeat protein